MINHCDRCITHLGNSDIFFVLFNLFMHFGWLQVTHKRKFEDILHKTKDIFISPRWVIRLSQWFIMLCLWLYSNFLSLWMRKDSNLIDLTGKQNHKMICSYAKSAIFQLYHGKNKIGWHDNDVLWTRTTVTCISSLKQQTSGRHVLSLVFSGLQKYM
jgi:hypothetical protein